MKLQRYSVCTIIATLLLPTVSFAGFFDAIFGKTFKDGIIVNRTLQKENVINITNNSKDIYAFIKKIYEAKIINNGNVFIVDDVRHSPANDPDRRHFDNDIFALYCRTKGGDFYKWDNSNKENWIGANFIYGCEINGKLDSAQIIGIKRTQSTDYPYDHSYSYVNKDGLAEYFNKYRHETCYVDPKGEVSIKYSYAIPGGAVYDINFKLNNMTSKPKEIDFADIKINVDGDSYDIEQTGKPASNNSYKFNWLKYKLNTTFVDNEPCSKMRLHPKQEFTGTLRVKVMGLEIVEFNKKQISLLINGDSYSNFTHTTYYDLHKVKIDK